MQETLATAPKRLQRLLLRLQQYDVEIRYKPGPEMYPADTLSRAYLPTTDRFHTEKDVERIHAVDFLGISEPRLVKIQQETAADPVLQSLTQVILKGWPERKDDLPIKLHPYLDVWDELTAQDGVLVKGLWCLILSSLSPKIRECLHGAHTGVESCLRRAREIIYWPSMPAEIKDYISECKVCASYKKEQLKEPLISHKIPSRPQETVGSDIFHFRSRLSLIVWVNAVLNRTVVVDSDWRFDNLCSITVSWWYYTLVIDLIGQLRRDVDNRDYLCTVDYYSSYFEIDPLKDKTAREVIYTLKRQFSRHGIPNTLMSDNGPPFNSNEFQQFATNYDMEYVISSPHYPQSERKVENAIKTAKSL